MSSIRHSEIDALPSKHRTGPGNYEYIRRDFVPRGTANQCAVSI